MVAAGAHKSGMTPHAGAVDTSIGIGHSTSPCRMLLRIDFGLNVGVSTEKKNV